MVAIKRKKTPKAKLSDSDRHARFVETARKVGASEDPKDFDMAFEKAVKARSKKI